MFKDINLAFLKNIVKLCQENNLKLLLVTIPAHIEYRKHLELNAVRHLIQSANDLAEKYENVFYLNLLEDKDFYSSDYFDADHLNHDGAKKLSVKLNEFIQIRD